MAEKERESDDRVWVLETQTKGTGANMVPLERTRKRPDAVPGFGFRKPARREPEAPAPRAPYRFKVTDVMTREVLGEDLDARATVALLEAVRSIVDVIVYVWEPEAERWRMLSFGETQALWARRGTSGPRTTARSRSEDPA
jgi:hypothetical protein